MKKKKQKKWIKLRHRVIRNMAYVFIGTYTKLKYGLKVEKFKEKNDRPYLILFNHQTAFDQFIVGMAFHQPVYYVASEDLFSNGFVSKLLRWAVAPIPIKKQSTDLNAVMNCIRVAREGGTIAIAPEGNRTFNGETVYMSDAIAPLAKKLKLPIALYRLEGGYGVHPRWSDVVRKGKMRSYVSRVIEPGDYAKMSNRELFEIIQKELYVDEAVADSCFKSDRKAEYLERAMYVCPWCGLTEYKSQGNEITCQKCGKTIAYGEDKSLKGVNCEFPFPFVKQWYQHQMDLVNSLDLTQNTDTPLFTDRVDVSRVILYKQKQKLSENVTVQLYPDRIRLDNLQGKEETFFFDRITVITVLGKNKLNIYYDKQIYQFKGDARFNALKYVNLCHRHKNQLRGEEDVEFLGL